MLEKGADKMGIRTWLEFWVGGLATFMKFGIILEPFGSDIYVYHSYNSQEKERKISMIRWKHSFRT